MAILDHIGIAVGQKEELVRLFGLLGIECSHTEKVDEQKVVAHFLPLPREQAQIELLEPTDPESTIRKYIDKRGQGIHHLSFRVEKGELDDLSEKLTQEGYRLIYPEARRGAHQMRINFIHPSSAGGILIEIMEPL